MRSACRIRDVTALPREKIETQVKAALKAGDKIRLATLRLLLSAINNKAIELGRDVEEDELHRLVQTAIKQRQESARQYREAERSELADRELAESAILQELLPAQASEEEIRQAITEFLADADASGPAAIGAVMQAMMQRFAGSADGATVNRLVREILG